jgi:hypothetical protein
MNADVRQAIYDRATQLLKTRTFSLEITSCPYQDSCVGQGG